jgi:putative membrane protein
MMYLSKNYPIGTWSFFFGVILMSVPMILRKIKWKTNTAAGIAIGFIAGYLLTLTSSIQTPDHIFFVFLAGALAICAMVVPGISGVLILLLIGKYQYIVTALHEFNVLVILVFALGCIAGLIGVSRLLTWALNNYHQVSIAMLCGLMTGALNKVWPWRKVVDLSITGKDPQLFQAIFMMALGVLIVVLIEKIAVRLKTKH